MIVRYWSLVVLACLALHGLSASNVVLKNGDTLSGQLVREDDKNYYMDHPYLGLITIKKENIAVHPKAPEPANQPKTLVTRMQVNTNEKVPEGVHLQTLFQEKIDAIKAWRDQLTWHGRIHFGYEKKRSTIVDEKVTFGGELKKELKPHTFTVNGQYKFSTQSDGSGSMVTKDDRLDFSFQWQYDLSRRVFLQSTSKYKKDRVQKIENEFFQSLGVGYKVIEEESMKLSLVPAGSVRFQNRSDAQDQTQGFLTIYEELQWKTSDWFRVVQDFNFSVEPSGSAERYFSGKIRFISNVTELIEAEFRYEIEYDSQVAQGVEKRTEQYTFLLGIPF